MPPLSVFGASCYAPVPFFFSGYHAGIKTCHLPRWWAAGVPPPPPTHTHFLCQWSAAPLSVSEIQLWLICPAEIITRPERWASVLPKTTKVNRHKNIWPSFSLLIVVLSLLLYLKKNCISRATGTTTVLKWILRIYSIHVPLNGKLKQEKLFISSSWYHRVTLFCPINHILLYKPPTPPSR